MTASSIFSINLRNRKNPSNLNYHMSIKKSQAILKHFKDLKFSVWFTLCSENEKHVLWHLELFSGRLPVNIVNTLNDRQSTLPAESLRSFLGKSGKRKEEAAKSVTKHGFVFWAQRKPNAKLEIYEAFRIAWLFLIEIAWDSQKNQNYCKYRTAGH